MMTTSNYSMRGSPGILDAMAATRPHAVAPARRARFVTASHAVSAPIASPGALFVAATIAVGLYLLGRRISA